MLLRQCYGRLSTLATAAGTCRSAQHRLLPAVSTADGPGGLWQLSVATVIRFKIAPKFDEVEYPAERRKLKIMEKQPQMPGHGRPPKMFRRLIDMRGPELVHNKLKFKQYGIRAKMGGQMHSGHFEMVRLGVNRKIDDSRMFAEWRVDAPWKPWTRKGQGHRMGGGKGSIDRYYTPVKAGRIIIEIGGHCEYEEVYPILRMIAQKLPFKAEPINQKMLEEEKEHEEYVKKNNINPFTFEYCLKNNFLGSRSWASKYDYIWHGKHR